LIDAGGLEATSGPMADGLAVVLLCSFPVVLRSRLERP